LARKRRNCRNIDGILLLDKPRGVTSNQALQTVKHHFHACKAGHTGSLDPIATGLLPLCFGEATKISQFLLDADKRYWTAIRLGVETTTYDADGEVVATQAVSVKRRALEAALKQFEGEIQQIPPMYSAVKHGGKALYKLARQGIEVERQPRSLRVHEIRVLDWQGERLELEIHCTKGTYVRSLAHDLGQVLGCGAHMAELRRLGVGGLDVAQAVPLEQLLAVDSAEALLLPIDQALSALPGVSLTAMATHYLLQGQPVSVRHTHAPGWVRLYEQGEHFLGMGEVLDDGRVAPKRLMRGTRKA